MKGEAADITTGSVADNLRLFERIAASAIPSTSSSMDESGPLDPYFIPCRREEPKAGVASVRNEGSCQELFDNRPELEYAL